MMAEAAEVRHAASAGFGARLGGGGLGSCGLLAPARAAARLRSSAPGGAPLRPACSLPTSHLYPSPARPHPNSRQAEIEQLREAKAALEAEMAALHQQVCCAGRARCGRWARALRSAAGVWAAWGGRAAWVCRRAPHAANSPRRYPHPRPPWPRCRLPCPRHQKQTEAAQSSHKWKEGREAKREAEWDARLKEAYK